jgi:hypothetical protein
MPLLPPLRLMRIAARLLAAGVGREHPPARRSRFRLLVVGPAILMREPTGGWRVSVVEGPALLPTAARLRADLVVRQPAVRVAAALLDPLDLAAGGQPLLAAVRGGPHAIARPEFYGWSLLYQLPGDGDLARVDPHESLADLPAFYESPLELADRQEHLAHRGIPSRALALLTARADFDLVAGRPRNRFCDHARWRHAGAAVTFGG